MFEILQYEFMRNALAAGLIASVLCGVIGVYVILNRIVFIGDGVAHAAFGGIGIGYLAGIDPLLVGVIFALACALGIGRVSRAKVAEDTAIGVFLAMGMAVGVLCMSLGKGYGRDLFDYLFGNILAVTREDVYLVFVLTAIMIAAVALLYKELLITSFDPAYAEALGVPVESIRLLLLSMVALSVVVLIKIVGIVMVIALLTIPAAVSRQHLSSLINIMIVAVILGMAFVTSGLAISYIFDLPSGATIILVASAAFFLSTALSR